MLQITYPKVDITSHPAKGEYEVLLPDSSINPSSKSSDIVREIIDILNKASFVDKANGEWRYINSNKRTGYLNILQQANFERLNHYLANMFVNDTTYGLTTPSSAEVTHADLLNNTLLDIDTCIEFCNLKQISYLSSTTVGNPFGILYDGFLISPDNPRHYYFSNRLYDLTSPGDSILEIGGGYGGVIRFLREQEEKLDFNLCNPRTYINVDLFESAIICYYFLRHFSFPVNLIFEQEQRLKPYQVNIVCNTVAESVLKNCQCKVSFNTNSFSEMSYDTVESYFHLIQNVVKSKYIFHQNSNFDLYPDSVRHKEILSSQFPVMMKVYKKMYQSICPFICGSGRYREFLYERNNNYD